jgi:cell wall-associated NlpC family hydrolase
MDSSTRTVKDKELDLIFWSKAVEWIDTPFVHQQATPWGCDCVGLVVGIAKEMGYDLSNFDMPHRPLNAISDILLQQVKLTTIRCEDSMTGCLLLFKIGRYVQHLAIYNDGYIIHTDRTMQMVKMINYPDELRSRLAGIYALDWENIPKLRQQELRNVL